MTGERDVPRRNAPVKIPSTTPLDIRTRAMIGVAYWLLRILGATWRVRVHGRSALLARQPDDPRVVLTLWHGQMLPILWCHRQPTASMISEHKDGEIIARILGRLGFSAIRGSTSRGGARALLEAVRVLKSSDVAVTPDGPRGPQHAFAPGALAIASRAGSPIVPIVASVDRKWQLKSWDAFEIPKPFSRITISYGTPVRVDDVAMRQVVASTSAFASRMHAELDRVTRLANGLTPEPIPSTVDFAAPTPVATATR